MKIVALSLALPILAALPQSALAWGDDGHKTIALIAQQCLTPKASDAVKSLLAADTDNLVPHDIANAATWADKFRDENNRRDHYQETQNWHFTDIEIATPDLTAACFGRKPLPARMLASDGPPQACAVDKVEQFGAELADSGTDAEERVMALKFVLHFAGDLHQPLHSPDNHDYGGNSVKVTVEGFKHTRKDELHGFWDTQFVDAIAKPPTALSKQLLAEITPAQAAEWAQGKPEDWAMEAFNLGKNDAYGSPPLSKDTPQQIDAVYVAKAETDVKLQLKRAGVRLALFLDQKLASETPDWNACLKAGSAVSSRARTRQ
ncbi:S1/P1 nuclease [Bradyrhizobium sp. CCBAU 53421]|uniref:S1/P1 nuclease n=1 Tax=Bradyrhizobium sp. CCBAU 53421 TaxID=1325120 RepID=UPI00188BAA21|nr:S1/P1 nuclease [Bradyrhizobium sp. CCBAU 53421]QOZ36364.1 S1/P1 Nuclease [Bradyrhizobium sp. CCBAU 53421]